MTRVMRALIARITLNIVKVQKYPDPSYIIPPKTGPTIKPIPEVASAIPMYFSRFSEKQKVMIA